MTRAALALIAALCAPAQAQQPPAALAQQPAAPAQQDRQPVTLSGHTDTVRSLAWSRDGKTLYSTGDDGRILAWDPAGSAQPKAFRSEKQPFNSVTALDDGRVAAANDFSISLWNADGSPAGSITSEGAIFAVTWLPLSKLLAAPQQDGMVQAWNMAGEQPVALPPKRLQHTDLRLFQTEAAGRLYATADSEGSLGVFDYGNSGLFDVQGGENAGLSCVAANSARNMAAAVSLEGTLRIWKMPAKQPEAETDIRAQATSCLFTPAGDFLAVALQSGRIRVYSSPQGTPVAELPGRRGGILALAFSPDGATLAAAGEGRDITLWPVSYPAGAAPQGLDVPAEKKVPAPVRPQKNPLAMSLPGLKIIKAAGIALAAIVVLIFIFMTLKSIAIIMRERRQYRKVDRSDIPQMAPGQQQEVPPIDTGRFMPTQEQATMISTQDFAPQQQPQQTAPKQQPPQEPPAQQQPQEPAPQQPPQQEPQQQQPKGNGNDDFPELRLRK